jgi:hypothetical protein
MATRELAAYRSNFVCNTKTLNFPCGQPTPDWAIGKSAVGYGLTTGQTHRQTDRQAGGQTGRYKDRQTDRMTDRMTNRTDG